MLPVRGQVGVGSLEVRTGQCLTFQHSQQSERCSEFGSHGFWTPTPRLRAKSPLNPKPYNTSHKRRLGSPSSRLFVSRVASHVVPKDVYCVESSVVSRVVLCLSFFVVFLCPESCRRVFASHHDGEGIP